MGSYLGTVFALPDSLFAGAVPAASAAAAALTEAALPAAPDSAAAHPLAAIAKPAQQDAAHSAPAQATAEARDSEGAAQPDDARPPPEADQAEITCRACDIGARKATI